MKKIIFTYLFLLIFLVPVTTSAHVLVQDEQESSGIIIHVTPDDDPYARTDTDIFFDIENEAINTNDYDFKLNIKNNVNDASDILTVIVTGDTSFATQYNFKELGTYYITLQATPTYISGIETGPVYFNFTQEVNRVKTEKSRRTQGTVLDFLKILAIIGLLEIVAFIIYKKFKPTKKSKK